MQKLSLNLRWRLSVIIVVLISLIGIYSQGSEVFSERYIPDISTFMKIGHSGDPAISRSTGEFFFTSSITGVTQIYRLTPEGWPYQLTMFDDGINWYTLSHDGRMAIVGAAEGGTEDFQMYLMDTRTGRITKLTDNPNVRYGSVFWKKNGSGFYFRANLDNPKDFFIYYYDLTSAQKTRVFDLEGSNVISNLSYDERYLIIYHFYSNVSSDIYMLDLETGQSHMITSGKENVLYADGYLMTDNKNLYLLCNDNEDGVLKRAVLDIASGRIEFLEPTSKWRVDELRFSPDRRYMAWIVNENGYAVLKLWDMKLKRPIASPPLHGVVDAPYMTDNCQIAFRYTGSTIAPDVYVWDWKKPELRKITHATYAGIDPSLFVEPELITYESHDGLEIPAFLFLPPEYDGNPIPFIIHAHGGPESQFRPYFQRHFQYLLLNGYGILAPNVRGSKGYGKEYINLDNYKNRMSAVADYKAAAEYLIQNSLSRNGMIGIKGTSYGGYVVLACITEYPDLFSAAVDQVGIANFVTFLNNTRDYRREIREAEYGPLSDEEFLNSISPIHKADRIKTPLLIIHGENDPRVPVGEARQMIDAITAGGGTVDSLIFPDEGHGVAKLENRLQLYRKMVEFFDKYLR